MNHVPKVPCVAAIVDVMYPRGSLPAEGYRCPVCGEELFTLTQLEASQRRARALGLFGPERVSRRKLRQVGTSLSVTLDKGLLRELMPDAKAGDEVEVGLEGGKIVIRPLTEEELP